MRRVWSVNYAHSPLLSIILCIAIDMLINNEQEPCKLFVVASFIHNTNERTKIGTHFEF